MDPTRQEETYTVNFVMCHRDMAFHDFAATLDISTEILICDPMKREHFMNGGNASANEIFLTPVTNHSTHQSQIHYVDREIARHSLCDDLKYKFFRRLITFLNQINVLQEHVKIGPPESVDLHSLYRQQLDRLDNATDITLDENTPLDVLWGNGISLYSVTKARTQMRVGKNNPRFDDVQVKEWCDNEKRMKKNENQPPKFVRTAAYQQGKGKTHPMPRPQQVSALPNEKVRFCFRNVVRISSIELDPSWALLSPDTSLTQSEITGYFYADDDPHKICERRNDGNVWHIGMREVVHGEYTFEMTTLFSNLLKMTVQSNRVVAKQNNISGQFCPKECFTKPVTKKRYKNYQTKSKRAAKKARVCSAEKKSHNPAPKEEPFDINDIDVLEYPGVEEMDLLASQILEDDDQDINENQLS